MLKKWKGIKNIYKIMSGYLCIATLLKLNLPREDLIKFLFRVESSCIIQYLDKATIYSGSNKSKKN